MSDNEYDEESSCWDSYLSCVFNNPFVMIMISIVVAILLGYIKFGIYGFDIGADDQFYRWGDSPVTNKWDAFADASTQTYSSTMHKNLTINVLPSQSQKVSPGIIIYEKKDGNILDIESVREVWRLEETLWENQQFDQYCYKPNESSIIDPSSGCIYFQSLILALKQVMIMRGANPTPENLTSLDITMATSNPITSNSFLGRDYNTTLVSTTLLRSFIYFGLPLDGYKNAYDRKEDQINEMGLFGLDFIKPIDVFNERNPGGVYVYSFLPGTSNMIIESYIENDVYWLAGAFIANIVIVFIHIGSIFLSFMGVLATFLSIPCAIGCTSLIGIQHFDALNVLGLFLICGIGSDSIFMYYDLLKQRPMNEKPYEKFRKTARHGIFVTGVSCITTAICFISLITSGVRVMQFYGIFCFFEMISDWILGATLFLGSVAIWLRSENNDKPMENNGKDEKISVQEDVYVNSNPFEFWRTEPPYNIAEDKMKMNVMNGYEKIFHDKIAPFVFHYRLIIVLLFLCLTIVMGFRAFQIKTTFKMEFFDSNNPIQYGYELIMNDFQTSYYNFELIFVWGISPSVNPTLDQLRTVNDYGTAEFILINFSNSDNQLFLDQICDFIDTNLSQINKYADEYLVCPMKLLKSFALENSIGFPIPIDQFDQTLELFKHNLSTSLGKVDADEYPGLAKRDLIGFDYTTGKLKYLAIRAVLNLPTSYEYEYTKSIYDSIQIFESNSLKTAPLELKSGFTTSKAWIDMETQGNLMDTALIGIISSIGFAVIIIFFSTFSFSYTLIFLYSLVSIVITIIGILELSGWTVGMAEAVMLTISSGFCCDYIIHTLIGIANENSLSRLGKIQHSLSTYCTPITFALLTSIGSAVFLYPAEIIIFPPFATFIILSGFFGILYGLIVIPSIAGLIGPDQTDDIRVCCRTEQILELSSED